MKLNNGILDLELTLNGGEMASLTYKGYDVLYKGDKEYWSGKNPTLFPFISSPNDKKYEYNGHTYPCRNHGLIRYSKLLLKEENKDKIVMVLKSNEETRKEYPFDFEYEITYRLDNSKVLIDYKILNKSNDTMPFTFGLHPAFIVRDFNDAYIEFPNDEEGELFNQLDRTTNIVKLKNYHSFIDDVTRLQTVIFKNLKSDYVILRMREYSVKVDKRMFKYLALWTANINSDFICIEPWMSINDIKTSNNPFREDFELEYLKPNQSFNINYYIELI